MVSKKQNTFFIALFVFTFLFSLFTFNDVNANNNQYVSEVTVYISLIDADTRENLSGGKLQVRSLDNLEVGEIVFDTTNAPHELLLPPGAYVLGELETPNGYEHKNPIQFNVNNDGTVSVDGAVVQNNTVFFENKSMVSPSFVEIWMRDSDSTLPISGARLQITGGNLQAPLEWISSDQQAQEYTLDPGSYVLTELEAPEGYTITFEPINFEANTDGRIVINGEIVAYNLINLYNSPIPETVDETVDETIDETVDETIDETVDETIDETIDETVDETVDETIDETVDETIDETVDETIDETVEETEEETIIETIDEDDDDRNPKTNDNFNFVVQASLLISSVSGLYIIKKKKNN